MNLFGWRTRVVRDPYSTYPYRVQVWGKPWWDPWGKSRWRETNAMFMHRDEAEVVAEQIENDGPYSANMIPDVSSLDKVRNG